MYKSLEAVRVQLEHQMYLIEPDFEDMFKALEVTVQFCESTADRTRLSGKINTPAGPTYFEITAQHRVQGPIDIRTSLRAVNGLWLEDLHRKIRTRFDDQFENLVSQCIAEHILILCECVVPGSIFDKRFRK